MALASVANATAAPREPPPNEILELVAHGRPPPAGTDARTEAEAAGSAVGMGTLGSAGGGVRSAAPEVRLTASELLDALGRHAVAACPGLSTADAVAKMWGK